MTYPGSTTFPGAGTFPGYSTLLPPEYDPADGALPIVQFLADFTSTVSGPPASLSSGASGLHSGDGRGVTTFSTSRGRSTEIGAVQAGTMSVDVDDPLETLNPANTSSPLNSAGQRLSLYRPIGMRAWWPRRGNTINLGNYTTIDASSETPGSLNGWTTTAGRVYNVGQDIAPAWQGERSILAILDGPTGVVARTEQLHTLVDAVHTYSVWVRCSTLAPGTSVRVAAAGALSPATTATASYVRLIVTFRATAPRTDIRFLVSGGAAGSSGLRFSIDGEQLEFGDAATPWTATGPVRYPVWTGYIERYPQTWRNQGFHGRRPLDAVDALAVLSRTTITWSYRAEIDLDLPQLYIPYDDAAGPPKPYGVTGQIIRTSSFPRSRGGSIQWQGDTLPDGEKAVSLGYQFQNPAELGDIDLAAGQFCELDTRPPTGPAPSLFSVDTRSATMECWFKIDEGSGYLARFQQVAGGNFQFDPAGNTSFGLVVTATGRYQFAHFTGGQTYYGPAVGWPDGEWHHIAWSLLPDPGDVTKYAIATTFDGAEYDLIRPGLPHRQISINSIHHDVRGYWGDPNSKASVARLAFYDHDIGAERRRAHWLRGSGRPGETADDRARRLLDSYWGAGRFAVRDGSGLTLPADHDLNGQSVLSALEDIAAADDGLAYADANGLPTVESRVTRHTDSLYVVATFGEDSDGGELPYEDLKYDYDPSQVYSEVSLTRPGRSAPLTMVNDVTRGMVGRRVLSRSIDVDNDWDLEQAAIAYLHRYSDARLRVQALTLQPDSKPELWPLVLSLKISDRVRVVRRTSQGTVISGDFYVESIKNDGDIASSSWSVTLELSPVFVDAGWILGDTARGVLGDTSVPIY